jgi:hypothetical protein
VWLLKWSESTTNAMAVTLSTGRLSQVAVSYQPDKSVSSQ